MIQKTQLMLKRRFLDRSRILGTIIFSCCCFFLHGQKIHSLVVDQYTNGKEIGELVESLERKFELDFIFEDKSVAKRKVEGVKEVMTLLSFLKWQLRDKKIELYNNNVILILNKKKDDFRDLTFSLINMPNGQISGKVFDEENNEPIIGATVLFANTNKGTVTDATGVFNAPMAEDLLLLEVSYVGYKMREHLVISSRFAKSDNINIGIRIAADQLGTILVKGKKSDSNVSDQRMGIQLMQMKTIKQLPTFLGEVDPIKGVTTLPGVSSTGDIAAGFNVRGGENSQNLILQDGAIIFNPTHLFGFFSAFNPDFIQDVSLLKGGGPAVFGGRVSSVLDINTRNGDLNNYAVSGGVGVVSSRLTVEGPIQKNKSSFMLGGRLSYSTWFIRSYEDVQLKNSFANFYDLSAKVFQKINDNNYISVTGYYSYDDFNIGIDSTFSWYTQNLSAKWDHVFNEKSRSHLTLASSNYTSEILYDDELFGFDYQNGVNVLALNYLHEYEWSPSINLEFGLNANFSKINPGGASPNPEKSLSLPNQLNKQRCIEPALFIDGSFELNDHWAISAGLRYGQFLRLGADKIYTLDYDNIEGRTASISDTVFYAKNDIISNYKGLEPRVSLRYLTEGAGSIKIGYYRTQQFIHQVSTTNSPSPVDFWIASSPNILPQKSDQFSLGYFQNFNDNRIESSIELFYKKTKNTIDYIAGVDFDKNQQYEAGLLQGLGEAYGLELLLKKKAGRFFGWTAYTFSRSFRTFEGTVPELSVNDGKRYSSVYDQPHQLSLVLNYKLSKQVTLSTNFTYNTGRPLTIPISKYSYGTILSVNNYSSRNEYRGPDYHRLDVSLEIKSKDKPGKKYTGAFVISLYNVYGRKNAYAIYFDNVGQAFKTAIIGSIVPSLSYNFKIK